MQPVLQFFSSIRRKLSGVTSYIMAGILMFLRPITGVMAYGAFAILNALRNGVGEG